MTKIIVSLAIGLFASGAFAQSAQPHCQMKFSANTVSFLVGSAGNGTGVVTCWDALGQQAPPVNVNIEIGGFGPGIGGFQVRGVTGPIDIANAAQIEGRYFVGLGNIGAGKSAGDVMGFKSDSNDLAFQSRMTYSQGGGLMLNATWWTITLAE